MEDAIINILLRLPVKSLIRFRCVCKYWFSLINQSSFTTKHLHHHHDTTHVIVQRYSYSNHKYAFAIIPCDEFMCMPFKYHDLSDLDMPINPSIAGPFHGILCLWDRTHIALWNPAMRELRPLPVPQPDLPSHLNAYCHHFGFGLDIVINDYKLIMLRYFWDEKFDNPYHSAVVAVYTLGIDSFRLFEVDSLAKTFIHDSLCNTYMKGVYYWLTSDDDNKYTMLLFDMHSEVFRAIMGPPDIPKSHLGYLASHNDSIVMFVYNSRETEKHLDIWVMQEEGIWTKQQTTGPLLDVEGPLGFWKDGRIFLQSSTLQLILHNPNTEEMKCLGSQGEYHSLKVFAHTESIVSVKRENEWWDGDNSTWFVFNGFLHSILPS